MGLKDQKFILILSETRLENLVSRYNSLQQAKFYIEHLGGDFQDYTREHDTYQICLEQCQKVLSQFGRVQLVQRKFLPNFIFGPQDIVLALGRDGLVANTLKYLSTQPLLGLNPEPERWDGVLLPFTTSDLSRVLPQVLHQEREIKKVSMAQVTLNDGQQLLAVNDFFIGQRTHVSSRYELELGNEKEFQSSSGIIVSTGLGSTGWLKSVVTGSYAVVENLNPSATKKVSNKSKTAKTSRVTGSSESLAPSIQFNWDADLLRFSVREPFPSKTTGANLVFGEISPDKPLKIHSFMPENGVIFSDGIETDYLSFNSGITATITLADHKGNLVI